MENKRVPAVLEALCQFDCVNSSPSINPATPATQDPPKSIGTKLPVRGDVYRELIHARHHAVQLDVEYYPDRCESMVINRVDGEVCRCKGQSVVSVYDP